MSFENREAKNIENGVAESRREDLKWTLRALPTVGSVEDNNEDVDGETVGVDLTTDMVEPPVEDALDRYDAHIERVHEHSNGSLTLEVGFEPNFMNSGENSIRKRGGSYIVAIPPEAAENAGFDLGDDVEFYSRNGEIMMKDD